MARDQTLRHAPFRSVGPGPARGPGVVRILQQSVLETLLVRRRRLAHHTGQQPHTAIHHRHGRDLAARKHEIADRDLLQRLGLDDALVDALETPAHQHHARTLSQLPTARLTERRSAGRQQNLRHPRQSDRLDRCRQHVGLHHHAGAAPEGCVVDRPVAVLGEPPDVDRVERPHAFLQRLAGQALAQRARKHLREERQRHSAPHVGPTPPSSLHPPADPPADRPIARAPHRAAILVSPRPPFDRLRPRSGPAPHL